MPRMEKDSNADRCYSFTNPQAEIKTVRTNVAKAYVDFQKIPSSDLIWLKTYVSYRCSIINFPMDIETVASDPFYLPIVFG